MVLVVLRSNQDCSSDLLMPCAQEALQMAGQCPVFYRSRIFALSLMSQRLIQSVGVQCCWSFYLRSSRDPEISNLKSGLRYFHMSHTFAPFFWPTCFQCLFPLCGLQSCPTGKEIMYMPFMLFIVYLKRGKNSLFLVSFQTGFFGCLGIFLP